MKKNLLTVLILGLVVVNMALSAITMFSVTSTNKKTAAIVDNIASILNLEVKEGDKEQQQGETTAPAVSMANTEVYEIPDQLTILLKKGEDGEDHYAVISVSVSMNIKDKGYKTYGEKEKMKSNSSLIKREITDVYGELTLEEAKADLAGIQAEILSRVQTLFESQFIYKVTIIPATYS